MNKEFKANILTMVEHGHLTFDEMMDTYVISYGPARYAISDVGMEYDALEPGLIDPESLLLSAMPHSLGGQIVPLITDDVDLIDIWAKCRARRISEIFTDRTPNSVNVSDHVKFVNKMMRDRQK